MEPTGLIAFLIIGAIAGWLAGTLMKGGGFGLLGKYRCRCYWCGYWWLGIRPVGHFSGRHDRINRHCNRRCGNIVIRRKPYQKVELATDRVIHRSPW